MSDEIDAYMTEQALKGIDWNDPKLGSEPTYAKPTNNATTAVTLEQVIAVGKQLEAMRPPPANPDQCKNCGALLGKHFGGLVNTPATPIYFQSTPSLIPIPFGRPACYLCPDCTKALRERLR